MLTTQGKLLPFRIDPPYEKFDWYSLNGTGMNGLFVALETGNNSPDSSLNMGYTSTPIGLSFQGTYAPRFENKRKVRATVAGDTKYNTLGVTLQITTDTNEQGQNLTLLGQIARDQIGVVTSGESVPVLARGVLTLRSDCYVGIPIPGYVGVISGAGQISVSSFANVPSGQWPAIAGKFISSSGTSFGGYAQFKLEL